MEVKTPKVQLKSVELFYEVHGSGPLIAFVHGLTGNHLSWFHQMPEFTKRYRVLIYDQRYFGASQSVLPENGETLVDDLRELLDKVGDVKDLRLIGQSWGGNVALRFALKYPRGRMGTPARETLSKVSFPTLFITGEKDARTPPVLVKAAQELMAKSKLVSVPNSGHSAFLESPKFFNREVFIIP